MAGTGLTPAQIAVPLIEGKRDATFQRRRQRNAFFQSLSGLEETLGLGNWAFGARQAPLDFSGISREDLNAAFAEGAFNPSDAQIRHMGQKDLALGSLRNAGIRSDQFVTFDDPRARYLAAGTVVSDRPGARGMDPRIARARGQLYQMMSSPAISDKNAQELQRGQAAELGQSLNVAPTGNFQQTFGALQGLGGAGVSSAQTSTTIAGTNQQQATAARRATLDFLSGIFTAAQGAI